MYLILFPIFYPLNVAITSVHVICIANPLLFSMLCHILAIFSCDGFPGCLPFSTNHK